VQVCYCTPAAAVMHIIRHSQRDHHCFVEQPQQAAIDGSENNTKAAAIGAGQAECRASGEPCASVRSREDMAAAKSAVGVGCIPSAASTSATAPATATSCRDSGCAEFWCLASSSSSRLVPPSMAAVSKRHSTLGSV